VGQLVGPKADARFCGFAPVELNSKSLALSFVSSNSLPATLRFQLIWVVTPDVGPSVRQVPSQAPLVVKPTRSMTAPLASRS